MRPRGGVTGDGGWVGVGGASVRCVVAGAVVRGAVGVVVGCTVGVVGALVGGVIVATTAKIRSKKLFNSSFIFVSTTLFRLVTMDSSSFSLDASNKASSD